MTCKACGYEATDNPKMLNPREGVYVAYKDLPFIEIRGVIVAPFYQKVHQLLGRYEDGTDVKLYACPKCGTVKMEV
jgi:hypothetical protein